MLLCSIFVNIMASEDQRRLTRYISETLGISPKFSEWTEGDSIPYAIRSGYQFGEIKLLGKSFVYLHAGDPNKITPSIVAKHLNWIEEKFGERGILITEAIESYNRKRLIEQKVPFIVPGNQLYLPELGIDLREYLKRVKEKPSTLSPSAQLVLFSHLLRKTISETLTATVLANALGTSKMTMGRAIDELASYDLVDLQIEGRQKRVIFKSDRRTLWGNALPQLRSPVQKRVYVESEDFSVGILAGLTALAEVTMIVPPERRVRAVTSKEWKTTQLNSKMRIIPEASANIAPLELEIWKYDPKLLSTDRLVDPLSLYLSLKNETDERIEAACEDLLKNVGW